MFISIALTILYFSAGALIYYLARNLKNALIQAGALTPDTAVPLTQNEQIAFYFSGFGWSAFKMTADGRFYFAQNQWRSMVLLAGAVFVISIITFIFLILSYF